MVDHQKQDALLVLDLLNTSSQLSVMTLELRHTYASSFLAALFYGFRSSQVVALLTACLFLA
jgi:hypothetical protein